MEIGILGPLILTILILLFVVRCQRRAFREKEKFHETQMQQMARSFAAERHAFIQREKKLIDTSNERENQIRYRKPPPEIFTDNPYWHALSFWLRREKRWCCEKCHINLVDRQHDLHVHHILGKAYNSPQHLKVLCIACHAKEKDHDFMKRDSAYKAFLKWKREH